MYSKETKSPQTVLVIKTKFGQWPNVSHLNAALKALDPVICQNAIYDQNYSRHSVPQRSEIIISSFSRTGNDFIFFVSLTWYFEGSIFYRHPPVILKRMPKKIQIVENTLSVSTAAFNFRSGIQKIKPPYHRHLPCYNVQQRAHLLSEATKLENTLLKGHSVYEIRMSQK